ncbi:hypothetical protein D3C81_1957180 [compost metagenome]
MLLQIIQLLRLQHVRCHVLVLNPLIGENRRGQVPLQIHALDTPIIQLRNGVIAIPDGLRLFIRQSLQVGQKGFSLVHKLRQPPAAEDIIVRFHLFGG